MNSQKIAEISEADIGFADYVAFDFGDVSLEKMICFTESLKIE